MPKREARRGQAANLPGRTCCDLRRVVTLLALSCVMGARVSSERASGQCATGRQLVLAGRSHAANKDESKQVLNWSAAKTRRADSIVVPCVVLASSALWAPSRAPTRKWAAIERAAGKRARVFVRDCDRISSSRRTLRRLSTARTQVRASKVARPTSKLCLESRQPLGSRISLVIGAAPGASESERQLEPRTRANWPEFEQTGFRERGEPEQASRGAHVNAKRSRLLPERGAGRLVRAMTRVASQSRRSSSRRRRRRRREPN